MAEAQRGDVVRVHYVAKLDDGSVVDSSRASEPVEFALGHRKVIEGLDDAVVGMKPGSIKTERVPPERAFGERREQRVIEMSRGDLPDWLDPEPGQILRTRQPSGDIRFVTIRKVADERVMIDANHPLAGEELTIEMELVEIM